MGLVKRWADQVVHRRVDDDKGLAVALLDVNHLRHQHPGVAHDQTPRLENRLALQAFEVALDDFGVGLRARRRPQGSRS